MNKKIFFTLLIGCLLTACSTAPNEIVITKQDLVRYIPNEELLNCLDMEYKPDPDTLTIGQASRVIIELDSAYQDCKNKLNNIRDILNEE